MYSVLHQRLRHCNSWRLQIYPDNLRSMSSSSNSWSSSAKLRQCLSYRTLAKLTRIIPRPTPRHNLSHSLLEIPLKATPRDEKTFMFNLIIIPFHMHANIDIAMEDTNPSLKGINNKVIRKAPCSVAVFVDHGLNMSHMIESYKDASYRHFTVFFIRGADDRKELTYAWKMAGNPKVNLKVVQFIVIPNNDDDKNNDKTDPKVIEDSRRDKQIYDLFVDEFRLKSNHNPNIQFLEEAVNRWEQIVNIIGELEGEYDLYVVGRHGNTSLTKAFLDHYLSQSDN